MARDYRIGPRIGQGGMGDVYLAIQAGPAQFAKLVVQKRIRGAVGRAPDLGQSFLAEARLLARLSHPNLVQVLDLDWDAGGPFVVVEYLSGETLTDLLRQLAAAGRRVPWPVALRVMAGVAAGLAAAHAAVDPDGRPDPILHRDLTPSNVMVCYSGAPKIIDFGIAKLAAEVGDTRAGAVKGKLAYLAPELLCGAPATRQSDLFQLGVLLFEVVTGRRLFEASSDAGRIAAVLNRPIPSPGHLVADLPAAIDRIALALLARDPGRRTASADEARAQLEEVMRRRGTHVSEHDVGAWLRGALPRHHAERLRRERDCLRLLSAPDPSVTLLWSSTRRRRRRIAAAGALAALFGLSLAASLEWCGAASEADVEIQVTPRQPEPPAPLVEPLPPEPSPAGPDRVERDTGPRKPARRPRRRNK